MSSKPPEAPASANVPTSDPTPSKIPSIPVLSVGTPSRPPPGTTAALAAGIFPPDPPPRITTPSSPGLPSSSASSPPPPTSDPPPVRSDSNPPTARRLAPPPKPRKSVPVPGDGTPSAPPVASPPPSAVEQSALPPAVEPAEVAPAPPPVVTPPVVTPPVVTPPVVVPAPVVTAPIAPPAAAAEAVPPVAAAVVSEVAAAPAVEPAPPPASPAPAEAKPPSSPPPPPVRAPAPPVSEATPVLTPSVPPVRPASAMDVAVPVPPRPGPSVSGPPPAPSSGSMPPRPPRRPTSMEPPSANPSPPVAKGLPPELTIEPGGPARVTPPHRQPMPLPRPSEPPPPAHVIVTGDSAASTQHKPTPAPAINVMRIIAIGAPGAPPAAVNDDDVSVDVDFDSDDETPMLARVEPDAPDVSAEPAELDETELAPDSQETKPREAKAPEGPAPATAGEEPAPASGEAVELGRDDALSVPPEAPMPAVAKAPLADGEAPVPDVKAPPPPPRRPSPPRRSDSNRPRARRALKRPWWEDLFGEDFTRAVPRLSDKQVAREVDFIEESLGVAKGGVVLDLGCGAGHHAVDLASRGYGVVGYDLSVYQLALAADVAQERSQKINFLHGDMREMAFEAMFDGIYCWNTTFGYFEEDKNAAVAERIFRALKPGGMFLLDVANRDFAAMYSPSSLWYEGDSCVCMDDMSVDFITSRLRVKRSVIFDDGRARECVYSIRLYSLHELGKLLHDVGFRVTEASGHTSTPGVFFGEQSPRLIVLAQKP
ncbi:MAG TPA: methyltransferase domain-containing protein [Polyangiaceae bacterium]|nr:methyltransferase domain-containing protein [Polyangiaceae bacterium]